MTTTGTCPPLEDIAAFLDGTLEKEERARVMEHLAGCPSCYEVFAEVARFQEAEVFAAAGQFHEAERVEKQEPFPGGRLVPFPFAAKVGLGRWVFLAAAAVLALAIGLPVYRSVSQPPRMEVASLLSPMEGSSNLAERTWPWESFRGEGDDRQKVSQDSFLVGAWLVDRQVAFREGEAESARDFSRRIYIALEGQGMTEEAAPFRKEAQEDLKTPARREAFLRDLRETAKEREESLSGDTTLLLSEYLAFGKWTEATRLAAATESAAFFEERENRRFPGYLLKKEGKDLAPGVRQDLQQIRQLLDQGEFQEADFKALEEHLGKIIEAYKPRPSTGGGLSDDFSPGSAS